MDIVAGAIMFKIFHSYKNNSSKYFGKAADSSRIENQLHSAVRKRFPMPW
jgi:hypothetical protein